MLDATRTIPSMIRCQACLVTGLMQTSVTTEIERMSMPKHRSRRGEPLPRDAALVLRGDDLDPDLLSETAQENSVVYGFFGISVFVEVGGFSWETIASDRLVRAGWLAIFTVGDLLRAGLELWDTGRDPITMLCTRGARSWSPGSSVARTASWRIRTTCRPRRCLTNYEDRPSS